MKSFYLLLFGKTDIMICENFLSNKESIDKFPHSFGSITDEPKVFTNGEEKFVIVEMEIYQILYNINIQFKLK